MKEKTMRAAEQSHDEWQDEQSKPKVEQLVFVDETWTSTNMAPRYGRGPRGKKVDRSAPQAHWLTMTFVAALRHDRINAPCVFAGPINGDWFRAWTEQSLAPTLQPGDLVILDNLSSHKVAGVRAAIEARGAQLVHFAALQPIPQSDRTGFRQAQAFLARGASTNSRNPEHSSRRRSSSSRWACSPPTGPTATMADRAARPKAPSHPGRSAPRTRPTTERSWRSSVIRSAFRLRLLRRRAL